jgi:transcriptional regulator with XRE-family HTH domain
VNSIYNVKCYSLKILDNNQNECYNLQMNKDEDIEKKILKNGFPKRLRELRRQRNLSQQELGKIIGLHYTNLGKYERGLASPSSERLRRIADALGVTADYLIEGKTDEAAKAKLDDKDLLQMFKEVETFPEDEKIMVKKFLDALITKRKLQGLAVSF